MKQKQTAFHGQWVIAWMILFITAANGQSLQSGYPFHFRQQTIDSNIVIGYGVAIGDVDGDKRPDILLADKKQFVWYRNGDWKKFVMIENLTVYDNVCIAAEDMDGDGKVEVAIGAQWNPSETNDEGKSGAVYFMIRPEDPTLLWTTIKLYHEPTIHRMRWINSSDDGSFLVVLPLHGKENKEGQGKSVNMIVWKYPNLLQKKEPAYIVQTNLHLTHNLDIFISEKSKKKSIYIAGKEGIGILEKGFQQSSEMKIYELPGSKGAGEVRLGKSDVGSGFIATIEPMHGKYLVLYNDKGKRHVLDSSLNEGHALIAADILGLGYDQLIAGWRAPNSEGKVGIKLYRKKNGSESEWEWQWIDDNNMACEDLQVIDLNGDGKLEIIASGRRTHNLKIYWNN